MRELFQQPHQERERQAEIELIENLMQPEQDRLEVFKMEVRVLNRTQEHGDDIHQSIDPFTVKVAQYLRGRVFEFRRVKK